MLRVAVFFSGPKWFITPGLKIRRLLQTVPEGGGYAMCHVGVRTATSHTGPFSYQNRFLAASDKGTSDFALYQKANGDLYHVGVRKTDWLMVRAKMSDDYLKPPLSTLFAPAFLKVPKPPPLSTGRVRTICWGLVCRAGTPTRARYFASTSIDGLWTSQGDSRQGTNPVLGLDSTKTYGGSHLYYSGSGGAITNTSRFLTTRNLPPHRGPIHLVAISGREGPHQH